MRILLAVAAAAGTLLIGRVAYAREKNQPMPMALTAKTGLVLLVMYVAFALSV